MNAIIKSVIKSVGINESWANGETSPQCFGHVIYHTCVFIMACVNVTASLPYAYQVTYASGPSIRQVDYCFVRGY